MDEPFVLNNYVYSDYEGRHTFSALLARLALKEVELARAHSFSFLWL